MASTPDPHSAMDPMSGSRRRQDGQVASRQRSSSTTRARIGVARSSTSAIHASFSGRVTTTSTPPASARSRLSSEASPCRICRRVRRLARPTRRDAPRDPPGARAVVVDAQETGPSRRAPATRTAPPRDARGDTVLDGVLHQRLQQQVGHLHRQQIRRNVDADLQTVPKTNLLDVDIALQILDLLGKGHLRAVRVLGGAPQELAESDDHAHRRVVALIAHQAGDGIERVEHEVRLHLRRSAASCAWESSSLRRAVSVIWRAMFSRESTR